VKDLGKKKALAINYSNLGIVYQTRGDRDKAIEFYQKALKLSEDLGSKEGMAINYSNLGNIYLTRGTWIRPLSFIQNALKLHEELRQ